MTHVTSADGTRIVYDRVGDGPSVILVGGGLDDGAENAPLVPELAASFTVFNYARRGRGDSGDTQPYALAREVEDLAALLTAAGGEAHLFGASSGGALALEATAAGLPIKSVAVYEVPYFTTDAEAKVWHDYTIAVTAAVADHRNGDALELFMRLAGSSDEDIAGARSAPFWPALTEVAATLPYDAACMGDGYAPPRLAKITQPALVTYGDKGMAGLDQDFFPKAAAAIAAQIAHAQVRTIRGQGHVADPKELAPVLAEFFNAS